MKLRVVPLTLKAAKPFVTAHHRHNRAPVGGLFAAGVEKDGKLIGVAIAGRPIARALDNGRTVEITRVCTDGSRNACSMLYGAICRAARAIGYERVVTYTLAKESGTSLLASGFAVAAAVPVCTWNHPGRPRREFDALGKPIRPTGPKLRWERNLAP